LRDPALDDRADTLLERLLGRSLVAIGSRIVAMLPARQP